MFERILSVKYVNLKNSFVYLSSTYKYIKTGSCVHLRYGENNVAYFSVSIPSIKIDDGSIGINSLYAKALGIEENELVTLSEISPLPTVNSITISPLNNNDYEILEILAENVQSTLLDQIRVVNTGQKFVIWIGSNINVVVTVDKVQPVPLGMMDFLTEVHINFNTDKKPKENNLNKFTGREIQNETIFKMDQFKSFIKFTSSQIDYGKLKKFFKVKEFLVYRLVPLKHTPFLNKINKHCNYFNVFLSRKNFTKTWLENNSLTVPIFCSLTLLNNDKFSEKKVYTRLYILEDLLDETNIYSGDNIFVDDLIFETFECQMGSRVTLKFIEIIPDVTEISIYAKKSFLVNIEEKFKSYLAEKSEAVTVLNPDIVINIGHNIICSLKFLPVEAKFCVVNDKLVRKCKYVVHEEGVISKSSNSNDDGNMKFAENVSNHQNIISDVVANFSVSACTWENTLITGKCGSGKSVLLKVIAGKLKLFPNFIYTKTVNCKTMKGKTMDSLFKVLSLTFSDLVLYQPSVLILDDLHILCECVSGDEMAPNSIYLNRISEMLHAFLKMISTSNKIGVCATAESISKLNKNIYTSRGSHLFKHLFSVNDLTKVDRTKVLKYFFENYDLTDVNLDELSIKTEGFVIEDIVDFYNKTIFEAYKDDDKYTECPTHLKQHYFDKALENTCVLSLQNVQLHSPGNKNFSDIGGLHDIKKILVENLLWPAQYPNIFANAPLRLQSGILLYGPPGTGKTLLAGAAAKHCGIRLISIKGPELLSKYIGASEQAVRDVFEKAQSARPCILFFDEFDSLAPRRGHDNTGVTDRVVNQLLTQLDGVETLSGVCVLAATSRPDLLDQALLRPGRLDRQLFCPLPDKITRLEILTVLSKNLDLCSNVDFESIALSTDGYSGADLQSLLYTAQLSTIDHLLENTKDSSDLEKSQITQTHLENALRKTRPSLTKQERLKYENIYTRFHGGVTEDFKTGSKATLA